MSLKTSVYACYPFDFPLLLVIPSYPSSIFLSLCFSPFLVWEITVNLEFSFCFNICTSKQDDPKVHTVVEKLLDVLKTPSEAVQRAVSSCLAPLMQSKQVNNSQDG